MEFYSIEEIKEYFGIETNDAKEVSKEIKKLLQTTHSDQTGGKYLSGKQKQEHEDLTNALNFINNSSTEIAITNKEWTSIQKQINQLTKFKDEAELLNKHDLREKLSISINSSNVIFQKKHLGLKLTSVILTCIISALWIFPSIAEKHSILKELVVTYKTAYTIIWLSAILITAVFWINVKRIEKKDMIIKETYNLDATHNQIFKFFLAWIRIAYRDKFDFDFTSNKTKYIFTFSRDDLFNFILNYYSNLANEFSENIHFSISDLYSEISEKYKTPKDILKISHKESTFVLKVYKYFFKVPGEIDIQLANEISDIMILKLVERDIISKCEKGLFNDNYRFIDG